MTGKIVLRPSTLQDANLLFDWRNDSETMKASHSTPDLVKSEHVTWLKKTLSNSSRKLYVAEENGFPVGTVRAD
jgi:RimJ/RimL family protein N-acetyltransferase